jgi:hypothetical protein
MDKRAFHTLLNELKDKNPDQFELLENIQETFDKTVDPISDAEIRALKTFPIQFIPRIELDGGEWTTKLHIWAENGVPVLLDIDPMILTHKNSVPVAADTKDIRTVSPTEFLCVNIIGSISNNTGTPFSAQICNFVVHSPPSNSILGIN